uniref:G_PROTEIN_RECEP_F1_2 domain-containing protein n=1 Tax=Heterorhabditis bacteriophora TaxID=37862 RepID=A0A1I7WQI5_HETBA
MYNICMNFHVWCYASAYCKLFPILVYYVVSRKAGFINFP